MSDINDLSARWLLTLNQLLFSLVMSGRTSNCLIDCVPDPVHSEQLPFQRWSTVRCSSTRRVRAPVAVHPVGCMAAMLAATGVRQTIVRLETIDFRITRISATDRRDIVTKLKRIVRRCVPLSYFPLKHQHSNKTLSSFLVASIQCTAHRLNTDMNRNLKSHYVTDNNKTKEMVDFCLPA